MENNDHNDNLENKNEEAVSYKEVEKLALQLSPLDRARLVERLAALIRLDLQYPTSPTPRRSLYGVLAHLGKAPSDEEIDEARQEAWANFPREDI